MSDGILEAFAEESRDLLAGMEEAVGEVEKGRAGAVDGLFRHVHTLKGSAGIVGLARLEAFAHAWESRLSLLRQGKVGLGPGGYGPLIACKNRVESLLSGGRATIGSEGEGESPELGAEDLAVLAGLDEALIPAAKPEAPAAPPLAAAEAAAPPEGPPSPPSAGGSSVADRVRRLRERTKGPAAASQTRRAADAMTRIPSSKLERILSFSSDLVVALSNLGQSARTSGARALVDELSAVESLAASLYRTVLEARMVPFGEVAGRYVKAVEEIARDRNKKIRFALSGAETEIDKSLADLLAEPLLHLVRNAADHGVESPEARLAAGKPAEGTVALRARREAGLLAIRVEDDGAGIDPAEIRRIAVARGRIGEDADPSEEELFGFLFEPGFSLRGEVTRWSGRGIGLDAVKRAVAALRGTVLLESRPGLGTSTLVRLPLALSLVEGFVARVGNLAILVPYDAAGSCFEFEEEGGAASVRRTLPFQGRLIPAVDLAPLYDERIRPGRRVAVVLEDEGGLGAILVDEVGETISAAVRPLDRALADSPGIAGTAILGDGSMILVLDTAELGLLARRPGGLG